MVHKRRGCWLEWLAEHRACLRNEELFVRFGLVDWPGEHLLFSVVLSLLEQLECQVGELRLQGVLPLDMVENSTRPCERSSGRFLAMKQSRQAISS
jgi:hypothetical protein